MAYDCQQFQLLRLITLAKRGRFFLVLLFLFSSVSTLWAKEIPLYTYHTHAPFIVSMGYGLSFDLARLLSQASSGRYEFVVKPMSRPRVNKLLKEKRAGIIPWVNPEWFKDNEEELHLWSKAVLMEDRNAIISSKELQVAYHGVESVKGLTLGGVRGHRYKDIDGWVTKGKLKRVDSENHLDSLRMLERGRINFTIIPESGALYLISKYDIAGLFLSPTPHSVYTRRVIICNGDKDLKAFLDITIQQLLKSDSWKNIFSRYQ